MKPIISDYKNKDRLIFAYLKPPQLSTTVATMCIAVSMIFH